jgi:hypothetical protein
MACAPCAARRKAQAQRAAAATATKYEVVVNGRVVMETGDKQRAITQANIRNGKWRVKQAR